MKLTYADKKVEKQCTSIKEAQKLFGGNKILAIKLLDRINILESATIIKDIIVQPQLRFHNLKGRDEGYFAIDVKGKQEPWRIILRPLDEDEKPFEPCNIDEIAGIVQIVEIRKVSKHYE